MNVQTPTRPKPSALAMVPFVSVDDMMNIVNTVGVRRMIAELVDYIEADFLRWEAFEKKPRIGSHSEDGVIELMPTSDGEVFGFKYVNGHPSNLSRGFQTVTAFGLLASVDNGYPILLSEMTVLTALRTAATSAMVARALAPKSAKTMAMIGNGAQCEFQALAFQELLGIETVRLYDLDPKATEKAARNLAAAGLTAVTCETGQDCVEGAEIITTCTADKQYATVLTDNMVGAGVHINAIGGDCPGKTELHSDILHRADIFVEYLPQTRIEGEIQQLSNDHPVTEIWRVLKGDQPGRTSDRQITLFDSVGFAVEDFSALRYVHDKIQETGQYSLLDMLADPDDARDLFGMVRRARRA